MRRLLLQTVMAVILAIGTSGCVTTRSTIPVIRADQSALGVKMLKPGERVRSCRMWILGVPLSAGGEPIEAMMRALLATDREADVLIDVRIETSSVMTGLFNRVCVDIVGDVAREITVVRLPLVGDGHQHPH